MNVKDIAMKTAIANIFSTVQSRKNIAENFLRVKKLRKRDITEERTQNTTTAQVTLSFVS